jgi:hypothetical protein
MVAVAGYQNLARIGVVVGLAPTVVVAIMLLSGRREGRPQPA